MAVVDLPEARIDATPSRNALPADLDAIRRGYAELRQAAEMFADHQKARIRASNQVGSLTVDIASGYKDYLSALRVLEDELSHRLISVYRDVAPAGVIDWQKRTSGVGPHMLARLLGQLGHPRLALPQYWARNLSVDDGDFGDETNPKRMLVDGEPFLRRKDQLRQYCGHGRAERRRAGMTQAEAFALGNPNCKTLTYLIAQGIVKAQVRKHPTNPDARVARGDLGQYYLDEKAKYSQRVHTKPCSGGYTSAGNKVVFAKCKVDGHYAVEGDPFQPSHVNAIAYRHLGKRLLNELWDAAEEAWAT